MAALCRLTRMHFKGQGVKLNIAMNGEDYYLMWTKVKFHNIQ
jgi:hypothetical protein